MSGNSNEPPTPRRGFVQRRWDRPEPEWVRGICPRCGEVLVVNCYYIPGRGYQDVWECWESIGPEPVCTYRRVL